MAIAFTFPGQGSQMVGMGKVLAENFIEARAVFHEVDEALGQKLSTLMFEGPEEMLTLTVNAQPALMAVSLAIIRVLEARGVFLREKVSYVAGHSLGEYSALCAAGTFSLADTARLLRIRGNAMQNAVPANTGAMAAILGLEKQKDVEDICKQASSGEVCQIANDNGGGQFVISGSKTAVERAMKIAIDLGAKRAMMLPVSAPFHSSLMAPAAKMVGDALAIVEKHDPLVPLIANVCAAPVTNAQDIVPLLVEQVTGQVRWRETIEWFVRNGVTTLYEIGSGKILTNLARRISKEITAIAVGSREEIEVTLAALNI